MIAREDGGAAIYVLGVSLMLLLLVTGLGLADSVRASIIKTAGQRALVAATQSAARVEATKPAAARQTFAAVMDQNLQWSGYQAEMAFVAAGRVDPLSGRRFDRPTVSARLELQFHLEYLGKWLPEVRMQLFHSEPLVRRNSQL